MYGTGVYLKNPCYPTPITGSRPRDLSGLYKEIGNHKNPTERDRVGGGQKGTGGPPTGTDERDNNDKRETTDDVYYYMYGTAMRAIVFF